MEVIDLVANELNVHGLVINPNGQCLFEGKYLLFRDVYKIVKDRAKNNKKFIMELWLELAKVLDQESNNSSCEKMIPVMISSVKYLYRLASQFSALRKTGVFESLQRAICRDSNSYSTYLASKIIDYRLAIEWTNHLIYRDLYICAIMRRYSYFSKRKRTTKARGFGGPWGRLDLPVQERVFQWDDVDEEVRGRSQDIRDQRRYRMGLEDMDEPGVKEGFMWRELRNEPYAFDDEDSNPYPHRNILWGS